MTQRVFTRFFNETDSLENVDYSKLFQIFDVSDSMTIPHALVSHCNKVLHGAYITLEKQLNETLDPETYEKLNTVTQRVFDTWITLGYKEECDDVDSFN